MRKWLIGGIVLVLVMGGAYALFVTTRGTGQATEAKQGMNGDTPVLPPAKADASITADGKVVPVRSAALSFSANGVVAKVLVKEGERVRAGQVLARLESQQQTAAVAQAEAQVRRATARVQELKAGARPQELISAQAALDRAKVNLARTQVSSPPLEVAVAEADLKNAQAQYDLLKAGTRPEVIAEAEADVAAAQATLTQAQNTLKATDLNAPFAGTVAALSVQPGEYTTPGQPVLRLVDTSTWYVQTEDLTELSITKIREGDAATITFDAIPDLKLPGKVSHIDPLGQNKLGDITYTVTVQPEKHEPRLRWNMTAFVTILPKEK